MNKPIKTWALGLTAALAMGSTAHAAVMLTGSSGGGTTVTSGDGTTISSVSLTGGNAIAVMITSEGYSPFSATYGGQAMSVFEQSEGTQGAAVLYLINPNVSTGDIVISSTDSGGSGSDFSYSYITLSNVASVATGSPAGNNSTANGSATLSLPAYTTASDGGFVYTGVINNDFNSSAASSPDFVSGNADTELAEISISNNSARHFYGDVATAGTYVETYTDLNQRNVVTGVAFEAVPEPASLALMGLGGLLMLGRSRQRG